MAHEMSHGRETYIIGFENNRSNKDKIQMLIAQCSPCTPSFDRSISKFLVGRPVVQWQKLRKVNIKRVDGTLTIQISFFSIDFLYVRKNCQKPVKMAVNETFT